MKTNYRKNIGSVSHATMRPEDLIPSFISELESMRPLKREHRKLIRDIKRGMRSQDRDCPQCDINQGTCQSDYHYFNSEYARFDVESLFDALDAYAMPYFYFGAHPGDGSDYGYWLPEGFTDDFGGLKVSDLSEVPTGYSGEVLLVNDHGNCSLYAYSRGRIREIWAVV